MPDLVKSLEGRDLEGLRIIAELWGVEFSAPDARSGVQRLVPLLMDPELIIDVVSGLPEGALAALQELMQLGARQSWASFARRHGGVREMGPGRRDREKPYLNVNASPVEALWYRALVGRTFFDSPDGPKEFAYIPDDLLGVLPMPIASEFELLGRPASAAERVQITLADDVLLDDACTMLAALRSNVQWGEVNAILQCGVGGAYSLDPNILKILLNAAGLIDSEGMPIPDATRNFLEADRGEALAQLVQAWRNSSEFNELLLLPGLIAEGEWVNDPVRTRETVLGFLTTLPVGLNPSDSPVEKNKSPDISGLHAFWSVEAFVAAVRQAYPDYQRPSSDYDSWYLREQESGEYLSGFEHWDSVDGNLLRFFIAGPLHWLGIMDLAMPEVRDQDDEAQLVVTAFRFSNMAAELLKGVAPTGLQDETEKVTLRADGRMRVPMRTSRAVRYQLARFGAWQGFKDGFYRYRLTPTSLRSARAAKLRVHHLLTLLNRHNAAVPPNLVKALERWEAFGEEARLEYVLVLRLKDPALLRALQKSRAGRYLGEVLGPTAVIIRSGAVHQVLAALAELGYLGDVSFEEDLN